MGILMFSTMMRRMLKLKYHHHSAPPSSPHTRKTTNIAHTTMCCWWDRFSSEPHSAHATFDGLPSSLSVGAFALLPLHSMFALYSRAYGSNNVCKICVLTNYQQQYHTTQALRITQADNFEPQLSCEHRHQQHRLYDLISQQIAKCFGARTAAKWLVLRRLCCIWEVICARVECQPAV